MQKVILYHNNRCSKSRAALALLSERGAATEVVHYLDTPLSLPQLQALYTKLNLDSPRQMMRTKDDLYRSLGLDNTALSDNELLEQIAEHPALLERPIAVCGERAVIGRPTENLLVLFD